MAITSKHFKFSQAGIANATKRLQSVLIRLFKRNAQNFHLLVS